MERVWRVVGGEDKGGILVRTGRDLKSPAEDERLSTGALVKQEELANGRLRYSLLSGSGPTTGWVSLALGAKALVVPEGGEEPGSSPTDGTVPRLTFHDGKSMPACGLGVYRSKPGAETYNAVKWALELGYRMIDTAAIYDNEESVGQAIRDSGIPRSEIFLTTKLFSNGHGYEEALRMCDISLGKLGTDYLDLYLIHSPKGKLLVETWDALLELQRQGSVRSVGVSNFGRKHMEALKSHGRPTPVVNQIEMHPLVYEERKQLVDYCVENKILVQAYGSVLSGHQDEMKKEPIKRAAAAHGKTPAQVLLRWAHQMGFQVIPKSVRKERLKENLAFFDFNLSAEEVAALNRMRGALGEYWFPMNDPVDLGRTDIWKP